MLPRALNEVWEGMEENRRITLGMPAGVDPRSVEFPHPFFGNRNLCEWPRWIVLDHERQDHPQIEKVLRSLGK